MKNYRASVVRQYVEILDQVLDLTAEEREEIIERRNRRIHFVDAMTDLMNGVDEGSIQMYEVRDMFNELVQKAAETKTYNAAQHQEIKQWLQTFSRETAH